MSAHRPRKLDVQHVKDLAELYAKVIDHDVIFIIYFSVVPFIIHYINYGIIVKSNYVKIGSYRYESTLASTSYLERVAK